MTHLTQLWQKRFRHLLKELGKYGRLIFNDHFSIVLVILMGFGSFFYREQLLRLQGMELATLRMPLLMVVTFLVVLIFNVGRPIWLTRDPDKSYLFAQGKAWHGYWLRGLGLGLILPALLLVGTLTLVAPFLALVSAWRFADLWILGVGVILLKLVSYGIQYLNVFDLGFRTKIWQHNVCFGLIMLIAFMLPAPFHVYGLGSVVFVLIGVVWWRIRQCTTHIMHFNDVLEQETLRESKFYKWVSIFADVPHLQPSIKRRAYLDKGIEWLTKRMTNRYSYLYLRVLFRNNAYSGIWLRVMLFVALMIGLTDQLFLAIGLGSIGYILTIVQLVPVIYLYDNHPFQRLYPDRQKKQATAFQQPILWLFALQTVVYSLALLVSFGLVIQLIGVVMAWLIIAVLIVYGYIPWWAKKHTP